MAEAGDTFDESDRREIEELAIIAKQRGSAEAFAETQRRLDIWRNIQVNIGVIGNSGSGKSTFINAMRRLKPKEPGAAPSGVTQTTIKPTPYEYQRNPSVKLWDLPGVGTPQFTKDGYLEKIQFQKFDLFVIICSSRFTDENLWLAREIRRVDKLFYFLRSKVDVDIQSDQQDNPDAHNEPAVLEAMKSECIAELSRAGFVGPLVFLVCKNPLLYDFPAFEERFIADLPLLKKQVALLTLPSSTKSVIECKTAYLQKRVWLVALKAGLVDLTFYNDIGAEINTDAIMNELAFYKRVYGLDEEGIIQFCELTRIPKDSVVNAIGENEWLNMTPSKLIKELHLHSGVLLHDTWIPLIGILTDIVLRGRTIILTKYFLCITLKSMEQAALTLQTIDS